MANPLPRAWWPFRRSLVLKLAAATLLALAAAAVLAPVILQLTGLPDPGTRDVGSLSARFGTPTGPSGEHLFGVDQLGRDVLSRTLYGTRVSLGIALAATVITMLIGVTVGLLAGYRGGIFDTVTSRVIEAILVIPYLMLAIGISASCSTEQGCLGGTVRPGLPLVILVISLVRWPSVARIVRNHTLTVRDSDYVVAARLSGMSQRTILWREVLPNISSSVLVLTVALVPQVILAEAALSFLGVGVPPTIASWGGMIAVAVPQFPDSWWMMVLPGAALFATVLASTVVADGLQEGWS